jgi:hypothetical protein
MGFIEFLVLLLIILVVATVVAVTTGRYVEAIITLMVLIGILSGTFAVVKLADNSDGNDLAGALLFLVSVVALAAAVHATMKLRSDKGEDKT